MKKNYLIFGFEKSGQSAFDLIYNKKDLFYIYDQDIEKQNLAENKTKSMLNVFVVNKLDKQFLKSLTTIILSPGVSIYNWAVLYAKRQGVEVLSELELGFRFVKNAKLVAVTGTNGKTTTTRLIESMLVCAKKKAIACGNIGVPLTSVVKMATKNTIFVCETSSFQLEAIKKFKPNIACILNVTPDHINRHKSFYNYKRVKLSIAKNLDKKCYLVTNKNLKIFSKNKKYHHYIFNKQMKHNCCFEQNGQIVFRDTKKDSIVLSKSKILLKGEHNLQNVMCAITVCKILKIKNKYIEKALMDFKLNKHRLEKVFERGYIQFYDDSKATNIDATICAMKAFNSPTILILGGSDKGYDYDEIFKNIPLNIQHILCCGEVKEKLKTSANKFDRTVEVFNTLKEATNRACKIANLYETKINILLSPASASFDEFKNYKDRGEKFLEYIKDFYEKNN